MEDATISKSTQAQLLGVSRASLYYRHRKPPKDLELKQRIETVLRDHPGYGYRRVALALKENKKKVQRVKHLYGIKAYRRRGKKWHKSKNKAVVYPNMLLTVIPQYQDHVWVADFTHVVWRNTIVYIAIVYTNNRRHERTHDSVLRVDTEPMFARRMRWRDTYSIRQEF